MIPVAYYWIISWEHHWTVLHRIKFLYQFTDLSLSFMASLEHKGANFPLWARESMFPESDRKKYSLSCYLCRFYTFIQKEFFTWSCKVFTSAKYNTLLSLKWLQNYQNRYRYHISRCEINIRFVCEREIISSYYLENLSHILTFPQV